MHSDFSILVSIQPEFLFVYKTLPVFIFVLYSFFKSHLKASALLVTTFHLSNYTLSSIFTSGYLKELGRGT